MDTLPIFNSPLHAIKGLVEFVQVNKYKIYRRDLLEFIAFVYALPSFKVKEFVWSYYDKVDTLVPEEINVLFRFEVTY